MNPPPVLPIPAPAPSSAAKPAPTPARTLRRLFLTLFLRGRSVRGLQKEGAPKSVGSKLALTLLIYGLFGLLALGFMRQPVFTLSVYLHSLTFVFLGMFVAASAGEVLFNKEEGEILLHRPISARTLLWAKIGVLVEVSLWLAAALNLAGLAVGVATPDGSWLFPVVHAVSTTLEALFCTATIVLVYQLCLRWFGRERLDWLMTAAQVFVGIAFVAAGQILPRLIGHLGGKIRLSPETWWIALLPPTWFAGLDDALVGSGARGSWILAAVGATGTGTVLWLAFGKLAQNYQTGLQNLNETASRPPRRTGRRWIEVWMGSPPLRWWLRDPVARASFLLTAAYLARDRDTKLRVYPGLAPMLVVPLVLLFQDRGEAGIGGFGVCFTGAYLGLIPMLALNLLRYSQQWQAADLFRVAPLPGPASLCHGARRAVLFFLTLPLLVVFGLTAWGLRGGPENLLLALPGLLALPIYSLIPCLGGKAVPFSVPTEEAKSAGRGLRMLGVMLVGSALSGLALAAWSGGWFQWLLLAESILIIGLYAGLNRSISRSRWPSLE